jgi:CRISPR system Cascade subunit CasB
MHVVGYGLGRSVRLLMAPSVSRPQGEAAVGASQESAAGEQLIDERLRRRFVRVGTATTLDVLSQRLREIVLLLRKDAVPLDYALLADQLYRWQFPGAQADVRRTWGRDFHTAGTRARSNPRA